MATINAVILKHQEKNDGTWNVKICVNHKSSSRYIETNNFVTKGMLDSKGKLKKTYIDKFLAKTLTEYRERVSLLGSKLDFMSSFDLKNHLLLSDSKNSPINIIESFLVRAKELADSDRYQSSKAIEVVCRHLEKFSSSKVINALSVNINFLTDFERYLLTNLKVSNISARTYMAVFAKEFRVLMARVNNPSIDSFPIPYNPFDYYKPLKKTLTKKRNLEIEKIVKIFKYESFSYPEKMTTDLFMLSFFLCGMNPIDIYKNILSKKISGNLEYYRSKIERKRTDRGLTNVLITKEAEELIQKYACSIQMRYSSVIIFHRAFYRSWKKINEKLGFKCTMYYARHSFANIARQVCKFSKDDVSFALNHKFGSDITDVYIEPDWSVVHKVQMGVIEEFRKELKRSDE